MSIYSVRDLLIGICKVRFELKRNTSAIEMTRIRLALKYPDTAESGDAYDVEAWTGENSEPSLRNRC
jgi:hypothetical protein